MKSFSPAKAQRRILKGFLCALAPLREKSYFSGVPVGDGFCSGGFVAEGAGAGGVSGTTLRVGSGNGGAMRLLLLFSLVLVLALAFAFDGAGLRSSSGSGETCTLALGLALTFAGAVIDPPAGIPSSPLPVGGCAGCTGWLFGSAASAGTCCWFVFASPGVEFFVSA